MKHHNLTDIKSAYIILFVLYILSFKEVKAQIVPASINFANQRLIINKAARKEIQKDVDTFFAKPEYLIIKVKRAKQYFPFIEEVFKAEGFPDDFKYLAIQESGLIPNAVSTSNAIGFWQFKTVAAREVDLIVSNKIDHRKSIIHASRGAAKYITKNNKHFFDSWLLSLHAYQMGPGAVRRSKYAKAIGKKVIRITPKTYWYVKKYIAHKIAYEYALTKYDNIEFTSLSKYYINGETSFRELSRILNTDIKTLESLNQWIKTDRFNLDNEIILYPSNSKVLGGEKIMAHKSNTKSFLKLPEIDFSSLFNMTPIKNIELYTAGKYHPEIVKNGAYTLINNLKGTVAKYNDTLHILAIRGEVSLSRLLEYNDISMNHEVLEGVVYYFQRKKSKARAIKHYVVKNKESLWSISQKFGIRLSKLCEKNRMNTDDNISKGLILWLRKKRSLKTEPEFYSLKNKDLEAQSKIDNNEQKKNIKQTENVNEESFELESKVNTTTIDLAERDNEVIYLIKKGDTLYSISKKYNTSVDTIIKYNKIQPQDLKPGMELKIPK